MESATGTAAAQPLTVGGVVSSAWELYRSQAVHLWTIVAAVVIPVQVVIVVLERIILSGGRSLAINGTIYTTDSTGLMAVLLIVLTVLAALVTVGALSKCLLDAYTGRPTNWQHSLRFAAERLGPLLWLAIIAEVLLTVAFFLIVLPGIYLTVCWALALPVVMFEGVGGYGALKRSRQLVTGHWWMSFGALLVGIVASIALSFICSLILGAIVSSSSHISLILIASGLGRIIAGIVAYPILAAISAVLYIQFRAHKENVSPHDLLGAGEPPAMAGPVA
jgi:hypothetical protein